MKIKYNIILFSFFLLLVSCIEQPSKENTLSTNADTLYFDMFGGDAVLEINTEKRWSITGNSPWFQVNNRSGKGSDHITITAELNPNITSRDSRFTIKCGKFEYDIVLLQEKSVDITDEFRSAIVRDICVRHGDLNNDGRLSLTEASLISELIVAPDPIRGKVTSLGGIEYLPSLERIVCKDNDIRSLDLSYNSNLRYVDCSNNRMNQLRLKNCNELLELICSKNPITKLELSECPKLTFLDSRMCSLRYLYLDNNPDLMKVVCDFNSISELDLSRNGVLKELYCQYNSLSTLDLRNCKELEYFDCSVNFIRTLDLRNNTNLKGFDCTTNSSLRTILVSEDYSGKEEYHKPSSVRFTVDH